MKMSLKRFSFIVLLCGGVFYIEYRFGSRTAPDVSQVPSTVAQSARIEPQVSPNTEAKAPPFRWGQLESTDYHIYVANLRGIGCPEQTIRDIITADVDSVFAAHRQNLTNAVSGPQLQNGLVELGRQEDLFLLALLGPQPGKTLDASTQFAASSAPARNLRARSPDSVPSVPLVLQNVDLSSLKLNASELQTVDDLRQKFLQQVGSTQDPDDPAYRERWLKAQHECDDLLRGMLGTQTYMDYQVLAASQRPQGQAQ